MAKKHRRKPAAKLVDKTLSVIDNRPKRKRTPMINGLSYPRPGSHWRNTKNDAEVVMLPGRYDGYAYFYLVEDSVPRKMPIDMFYAFHSLIRQALPDEDYMLPVRPIAEPTVIKKPVKKRIPKKVEEKQ